MYFNLKYINNLKICYLSLKTINNLKYIELYDIIKSNKGITVSEIINKTNENQAIVSQRLQALRKTKLVNGLKKGKFVHYHIEANTLYELINLAHAIMQNGNSSTYDIYQSYHELKLTTEIVSLMCSNARMDIIETIYKSDQISVNDISDQTSISQSSVSQHLKNLLYFNLVSFKVLNKYKLFGLNLEFLNLIKESINIYNHNILRNESKV